MKTMRPARAMVAGAAALAMLLAACGESADETDVTTDESVNDPAATADETDDTTDDATTDDATTDAADGDDAACTQIVDEAAGVGDLEAAVDIVDEAIAACQDFDALMAAAETHTDSLDTSEFEAFVLARCADADSDIVASPVCDEVMQG